MSWWQWVFVGVLYIGAFAAALAIMFWFVHEVD